MDDSLATAWLTRDLRPRTRIALAELGHLVHVAAGDVVLREGDPTEFVAIVLEGRVALRLLVPERGQVTIQTVEAGDVVGWSAVVPPFRATSTAVALTDTELARFDGAALRGALAVDDALAAEIYPVLLGAVSRRLHGTRLQLLDLFSQSRVEPW